MELYNISQVSKKLELNKKTLRNWERDYNLKIPRGDSGNRYYTEKEIKLLENIKNWKRNGLGKQFINNCLQNIEGEDECATSLVKSDAISIEELQKAMVGNIKNAMSEAIGDIIIEREKELKKEFENKLENKLDEMKDNLTEDISHKVRKQVRVENQKLMIYLSSHRKENKKGFLSKVFSKK
ncbi:MerR family transcriptional regulator [Tepidibacter formicigenes]|jgi:DNA-binding transcriptional MerR regulator|uniref:MerR HTH family regulatory protein n=1 Tax=Tepidibacter formicigenes DSM 15518 TaxID=1123349 RepID=A0A1M6Q5I6_9FIRM|nr:MerR family transcriptional regulator [Tepidibacter formicigenes]SHK15524.1 MerR HTH family regulatory protein [Tepidibacter formicigenes DSM 15518]